MRQSRRSLNGSRFGAIAFPVLLALLIVPNGSTGGAQAPPPPTVQPAPDWTGFYQIARDEDLKGFDVLGANLHETIEAHLQPWARIRMEATDGVAEDPGAVCQPTGILRYPAQAGSFWWLPAPDKIVIVWRALSTAGVQRVYLNRDHPQHPQLTWNGDSIGRWDGDTLVVDTVGLNDKSWLSPAMEPHTSEVHLIQRIRQVRDGAFIEILYTVEDWKTLTSAYTYSRYYKKVADVPPEQVCNESPDIWTEIRNDRLLPILERSREVR